ncbi:addiction module protein [Pedobacter sp.]|uniref:addiction module protein n=1 Tax=Pedobacter sp. TaxID=1411316 RepID=UPI003D7F2729
MDAKELSFNEIKDAVKRLSPAEKLELNEVIWADDIVIPLAHQHIVNERISAYKANPKILLDWDVALKELKAK